MSRQKDLTLKKIFLDPNSPVYLTGTSALYSHAKTHFPRAQIKLKDVKEFLAKQKVYELHKPVNKKFARLPIRTNYVDALWMADLVDMSQHSASNDGFKWILTVIDTFSRFAFAAEIKTKKSEAVIEAFAAILAKSKRKPDSLVTDDGGEFFSQTGKLFFENEGIFHYST